MKTKEFLPFSCVKQLMINTGAPRVGKAAVNECRYMMEIYCRKLTKKAFIAATHANRRTIMKRDIQLVAETI